MPTDYHVVTIALDTTRAALERLGRTVVLHGVIVHGAFRTGDRPLGRRVSVDLVARIPVAQLDAVQGELGRYSRRWQDRGLQQRPPPPVPWASEAMPASPPTWRDAARAAYGAVCAALGWHPETWSPGLVVDECGRAQARLVEVLEEHHRLRRRLGAIDER